MTPDPTEFARVLAELEWQAPQLLLVGEERRAALCAAAAGLLREMAADFARFTDERTAHRYAPDGTWCEMQDRVSAMLSDTGCTCGLDAARAKWRLEP